MCTSNDKKDSSLIGHKSISSDSSRVPVRSSNVSRIKLNHSAAGNSPNFHQDLTRSFPLKSSVRWSSVERTITQHHILLRTHAMTSAQPMSCCVQELWNEVQVKIMHVLCGVEHSAVTHCDCCLHHFCKRNSSKRIKLMFERV